ncbi:MAG: YigZ family protein [Clostridia bacterium]|nr:YigZ family protein [Clostridia bacterium]
MYESAYRTLVHEAQDEFVEKRSRFIGYARPVQSEQQALDFIAAIKKRHWDARHNVYAYCLRDGGISRYSDDGEPQGTAGVPVLEVLRKHELTDCVVVVTRYFGGILLGTGGLVRAYTHAAVLAVQAAEVERQVPCRSCEVRCGYADYGRIQPLISAAGGVVDNTVYEDDVRLSFHIIDDDLPAFEKALADATAGTVVCEKGDVRFWPFLMKE